MHRPLGTAPDSPSAEGEQPIGGGVPSRRITRKLKVEMHAVQCGLRLGRPLKLKTRKAAGSVGDRSGVGEASSLADLDHHARVEHALSEKLVDHRRVILELVADVGAAVERGQSMGVDAVDRDLEVHHPNATKLMVTAACHHLVKVSEL